MSKSFLALAALLLLAAPQARAATHTSSSDSNYLESQAQENESLAVDRDSDEEMDETSSATTQSATDEDADVPAQSEAIELKNEEEIVRPAARPVPPAREARLAPAPAERPVPPPAPSATVVEAKPEVGGDLRAPSPKVLDPNRRGFFQLGVGPAYGAALVSDSLMYNVVGSYNFNTSERWTLKGLADLYMGTGTVTSRLYNFGAGAEYYISELDSSTGVPYVAGDAGIGFGRNAEDQTATALTLGAGAGFRFAVRELNCDINAHYAQMTANVGPSAPAVFAVRGSVAF